MGTADMDYAEVALASVDNSLPLAEKAVHWFGRSIVMQSVGTIVHELVLW
jgi:hypothetical protein